MISYKDGDNPSKFPLQGEIKGAYILKIVEDTTVDGPGFRTSIYAAGCNHRCPGCHNPQSWNIDNGIRIDIESILERVKANEFSNVTFSGGDPFMQPEAFTCLAQRIKTETDKTIWCYTGFRFEEILQNPSFSIMLEYLDVLVDGRFIEKEKDESMLFAGSRNQRLIDVQKSLKEGRVVLWLSNSIVVERSPQYKSVIAAF